MKTQLTLPNRPSPPPRSAGFQTCCVADFPVGSPLRFPLATLNRSAPPTFEIQSSMFDIGHSLLSAFLSPRRADASPSFELQRSMSCRAEVSRRWMDVGRSAPSAILRPPSSDFSFQLCLSVLRISLLLPHPPGWPLPMGHVPAGLHCVLTPTPRTMKTQPTTSNSRPALISFRPPIPLELQVQCLSDGQCLSFRDISNLLGLPSQNRARALYTHACRRRGRNRPGRA